jgi:uncharacterized protein
LYKILSLSGGGYYGLYTAVVLAELEERLKVPYYDLFDCIIGTSIGGMIAIALSANIPASNIVETITSTGSLVFPRGSSKFSFPLYHDFIRPIFGVKYSNQPLKNVLIDLYGENRLFDSAAQTLMVPTYNVSRYKPHIFQTLGKKSSSHNSNLTMVDVALAGSAAASLFPLVEIDNSMYMDGAIYSCCPDLIALNAVQHGLGVTQDSVTMLSIGSSTAQSLFKPFPSKKVSGLQWQLKQRLVLTQLAAQQQVVVKILRNQLGSRYVRLDNVCSIENQKYLGVDLATEKSTEILIALGKETAKKALTNSVLMKNILCAK